MAKAAMSIDRLNPLIEITVFDAILLVLFAFGFQDEHLAIGQPHEEIGPIFAHCALVEIGEMVVLDPGGNGVAVFQGKRIGGLPGAVVHTDVDVRFVRAGAGLAGVRGVHLARGTDGVVAVEDRLQTLGVFLADGVQHVLDDAAHVEGD